MLRGLTDDLDEVFRSFDSRRGRTAMLACAVALSVGVTVASLGIGRTAAAQIAGDLAAQISDQVTVSATTDQPDGSEALFDRDAPARARTVPLVRTAGMRMEVAPHRAQATRFGQPDQTTAGTGAGVVAVSDGYLDGAGVDSLVAWAFSAQHAQPVALVGRGAAQRLSLPEQISTGGYSIQVAGVRTQVVGTFTTPDGALDELVLIPFQTGVDLMGDDSGARLVVTTEPGAGARVAAALPAAIRPDAPTVLTASRVVDLASLREGVDTQLGRLTGMLGVVLTAITALLIGSTTASSVAARTAEIGLRRALGASSGMVVRLFLGEAATIGVLGGALGAATGSWLIVAAAHGYRWTAHMAPDLVLLAIALGLTTGIAASIWPAARAARISPAQAVRVE